MLVITGKELRKKIKRSMKQIKDGDCVSKKEGESMEQFLKRLSCTK